MRGMSKFTKLLKFNSVLRNILPKTIILRSKFLLFSLKYVMLFLGGGGEEFTTHNVCMYYLYEHNIVGLNRKSILFNHPKTEKKNQNVHIKYTIFLFVIFWYERFFYLNGCSLYLHFYTYRRFGAVLV